jgi:hypothetical protein
MMMNEEADPDDLQAVFAHEYEDVYDFQVSRRRQHPFTYLLLTWRDGCGSGFVSGLDPDSIRPVDPDPDSESGSGSRRAKMSQKKEKKIYKSSCFEVLDDLF